MARDDDLPHDLDDFYRVAMTVTGEWVWSMMGEKVDGPRAFTFIFLQGLNAGLRMAMVDGPKAEFLLRAMDEKTSEGTAELVRDAGRLLEAAPVPPARTREGV